MRYLPQPSNNSQSKEVIVGDESSAMCPPWYWLGENGTCQRGSTLYGVVDFDNGTGQTSLQGFYWREIFLFSQLKLLNSFSSLKISARSTFC